jgi:hypothetical protein
LPQKLWPRKFLKNAIHTKVAFGLSLFIQSKVWMNFHCQGLVTGQFVAVIYNNATFCLSETDVAALSF